jgi:hypothetical protein
VALYEKNISIIIFSILVALYDKILYTEYMNLCTMISPFQVRKAMFDGKKLALKTRV